MTGPLCRIPEAKNRTSLYRQVACQTRATKFPRMEGAYEFQLKYQLSWLRRGMQVFNFLYITFLRGHIQDFRVPSVQNPATLGPILQL